MINEKPFSPSCERNKEAILEVLKLHIKNEAGKLLEIGSGTGQHATYCSRSFPELEWFCSDLLDKHSGIKMWLDDEIEERKQKNLKNNLKEIFSYQVMEDSFPQGNFNYLFTANTFHIMSWEHVLHLIKEAGENLFENALFIIYGPFNYRGNFTSESNAQFELWLKDRSSLSGIRDFEAVAEAMSVDGFELVADHEMPANNRTLVFKKI
ncbi:MAG: DUF938 domain-containing protein [Candidatus Caenarcaniphilales bacterium]|nr:DUF938 domain-containing protein [Candidatus Caenarcaniphilales bacterium]